MAPVTLWHCICALSLWSATQVAASVTAYGVEGPLQVAAAVPTDGSTTTSAATNAWYTALPVYNDVILQAPALPSPAPAMQFGADVQSSAQNVVGISIQHQPGFYGFSIEMSVIDQVGE